MTMPSEIKELRNKIKELQESQKMVGTVILHQVARKVRACDFLDEEEKDKLINILWQDKE